MRAAAMTSTQREQGEQARMRALVRFNGPMFHSLATASILETAVPQQVGRLARVFAGDPDAVLWLEQVWWPRRAELGRILRAYVEATWPEFDWKAAYRDFEQGYHPLSGLEGQRARIAREALGMCVTETQAALLYRVIARSADEPQLRELARRAACEHAEFFDFFNAHFERRKRIERVGFIATLRTVTAISRSARDRDVAVAFQVLGHNWTGDAIVPGLGYLEFRQRMARLLERHAELSPVERLLFRPWLERTGADLAPQSHASRDDRWSPLSARLAAA